MVLGGNTSGQLGNGTVAGSTVPVHVSDLTNATQISGKYAHFCALKSDQNVVCWGWNVTQQLGDSTTTDRLVPTAPNPALPMGSVQVSAGIFGVSVLLTDGTVRSWGAGNNGAFGDGTDTYTTSTKTAPSGLATVSKISGGPGWGNLCAIETTGSVVKCWGLNHTGQLGIGVMAASGADYWRLTPVTVLGFTSTVTAIDVGVYTPCAVLADTTLMCWGYNGDGQAGLSTTYVLTPTTVPNLTGVAQVSPGYYHSCAVLSDTTVKCWGRNTYGALGNNTTTSSVAAVSVMAPASALATPASVAAIATTSTAKSIDVSWGASTGASSYAVKIYNAAGSSLLATKTSVTGLSTTLTTATYGSLADNTSYKVTVAAVGDATNSLDSPESSQVSVTTNLVAATPLISSQPSAASRTYGQSVTFSVSASVSDAGMLSYQWLKGGNAISSATSRTYTMNSLELSDAASYSVRVTNAVVGGISSSATSSTAALTVTKSAQDPVTLTSTAGTYGTDITLVATGGTGGGALSYAVTSTGTAGCSLSNGNVLSATTPGTCTVTATRATSTNYLAESSTATTVTFARQNQAALNVSSVTGDIYTGIIVSSSGGSGTGAVTYGVTTGTANCGLTSGVVTARTVGTCLLTVTKAADTYYLSATETFTLSFGKATPVAGVLSNTTTGTAGTEITLSFTGGSGTGAVTYVVLSPGTAKCVITNGKLVASASGSCTVTTTKQGDDTYPDQVVTTEFTFTAGQNAVANVASDTATTTTVTGSVKTRAKNLDTTTTTSAPITTTTVATSRAQQPAPDLVNTDSAQGAATIGGKTTKATTTRVNNQLIFTSGGFTVTFAGIKADGSVIPLRADGVLELAREDMFRLDAKGFAPGTEVTVWMFSQPQRLTKLTVGADGLVHTALRVPKSLNDGLHHVVMVGVDQNKNEAKFEFGLDVGVPAKQWWVSRVLLVIPISIAVFIGLWLPTSLRRRRKQMI